MAEPAAGVVGPGALGALLLSALVVMGSPGPATISLVAAGSTHGVRRSLPYLAGIVAGTELVLAAVAGGVTAALLAVPALASAVTVVAALYILWLAYHVATARPLAEGAAAAPPPSLAGGLLLGVSNPKAWVAIAAVFSGVHLAAGAATDAAVKGAVLAVLIVLINGGWLLAGASLAPLLRDSGRARVANATLAAALVGATALAALR